MYSPNRVNGMAEILGLLPGMFSDLSELDVDGKPWDSNVKQKRDKAEAIVREKRALLLIGSPMCSAFSQMQNLNFGRMIEAEKQRKKSLRD